MDDDEGPRVAVEIQNGDGADISFIVDTGSGITEKEIHQVIHSFRCGHINEEDTFQIRGIPSNILLHAKVASLHLNKYVIMIRILDNHTENYTRYIVSVDRVLPDLMPLFKFSVSYREEYVPVLPCKSDADERRIMSRCFKPKDTGYSLALYKVNGSHVLFQDCGTEPHMYQIITRLANVSSFLKLYKDMLVDDYDRQFTYIASKFIKNIFLQVKKQDSKSMVLTEALLDIGMIPDLINMITDYAIDIDSEECYSRIEEDGNEKICTVYLEIKITEFAQDYKLLTK